MPLTKRAELKIVASNDLKGLGATDGPGVNFHWSPPSPLPKFAPWLAILALLLLKPNRTAKAWWILVPLAIPAFAIALLVPSLFHAAGQPEAIFGLTAAFTALAVGVGGIWLLAPSLVHRLRFVTWLKMLMVCLAVTAFAYLVRLGLKGSVEEIAFLVLVGICVLLVTVSLSLAGVVCRRRYRPVSLAVWSAVFLVLLALGIALPFYAVAVATSGNGPPLLEFLTVALGPAACVYAVLLPFLVLAYSSGFYRERLKDLLQLQAGIATSPPMETAPLPAPEPLERSSP